MFLENVGINEAGRLTFAGMDTVALAEKHGTPMYLMDEQRIRANCRVYALAMSKNFDKSMPVYAGKALSCKRIFEIVNEEGLGADVVSAGELFLALKAGFSPEKIFFHGNSKPESEIAFAVKEGVGHFVVDCFEELEVLNRVAGEAGRVQNVLLRVTPGIDTHTFAAVRTGQVDSKFGIPIETGQAIEFVKAAISLENLKVSGLHCHIGSQISESKPFIDCAEIMIRFIAEIKDKLGHEIEILNLGGGYAVRYKATDPVVDIAASIKEVSNAVKNMCAESGVPVPMILMEPGRSIVANSGMTLYTVNGIKRITGFKNYVSIDGGMTDNPRFALYKSSYTVVSANRAAEACTFKASIAGRCCESGDMIQEDVLLPEPVRGDTIAVLVTGAYNYSMASNYNSVCRPPIVMLNEGKDYVAVRRETFEDLCQRDI